MSLPSLKDKLSEELKKEITTESQVVYILSRIRKMLEVDKKLKKYKVIKFYCDWSLHPEIEDVNPISDFFDNVHSNVGNGNAQAAFIEFLPFYKELQLLFKEYNLPEDIFKDRTRRATFNRFLSKIYSDTPLVKKGLKKRIITWIDNTDPSSPGLSRGGYLKIE